MSRLSETLVLAANNKGLTARKVALAAKTAGFTLNHDTAARYLRGDHGRPGEATLLALSAVLDVPMKVLREAADLPAEETEPYRPPSESSRLTRRQRRAVDEIIRAMLEPAEQHLDELDQRRARARSKAARRGQLEPPNH